MPLMLTTAARRAFLGGALAHGYSTLTCRRIDMLPYLDELFPVYGFYDRWNIPGRRRPGVSIILFHIRGHNVLLRNCATTRVERRIFMHVTVLTAPVFVPDLTSCNRFARCP